jgi:hypothetical protein
MALTTLDPNTALIIVDLQIGIVGYVLVCRVGNFGLKITGDAVAFGLGIRVVGLLLSQQFDRLHGGQRPERS